MNKYMGLFKDSSVEKNSQPLTRRTIISVYIPSSQIVYRLNHKVVGSDEIINRFEYNSTNPTTITGYNSNNNVLLKIVTTDTVIITYGEEVIKNETY